MPDGNWPGSQLATWLGTSKNCIDKERRGATTEGYPNVIDTAYADVVKLSKRERGLKPKKFCQCSLCMPPSANPSANMPESPPSSPFAKNKKTLEMLFFYYNVVLSFHVVHSRYDYF